MKIIEKLKTKSENINSVRQPVIAFLGDSVTQGCFELYINDGKVDTVFETKESYSEKVKDILLSLYPRTTVNIINAGISGDRAEVGAKRLERDVLSYKPDLVVVCYGLNDSTRKESELEVYINSLEKIFKDVKDSGAELIFMTPNLCCNRVDCCFKDELLIDAAKRVADSEIEGWLERFIDSAVNLCKKMNVPVCDCNKIWKMFEDGGVDINILLSNKVNHPTRDMHWLFAYELVKTMFEK